MTKQDVDNYLIELQKRTSFVYDKQYEVIQKTKLSSESKNLALSQNMEQRKKIMASLIKIQQDLTIIESVISKMESCVSP